LVTAAQGSDPDVRRAALLALRNVGGTGQTAALLDLLLKASSTSERRAITQTLGAIIKRAQPAPIGAVISAYNTSSQLNSRLSLLEVMGQASSAEALGLLRSSIKDTDPEIARGAILALTAWDNSTPLVDLLSFAKGVPPPANNLQVLALRGVLKLMLLEPRRPPSESGRLLAETMGLASQNAEKFAVLSLLQSFPSQESLEVARAAQRDPALANEAQVAFAQVTEALRPR